MRRIAYVLIMVFAFSVTINGVAGDFETVVEDVEVRVRDVITLRPTYASENTPKHEWLSSDETIATVQSAGGFSSGNVTGIKPGRCVITALDDGIAVATYNVTVIDAPLPSNITIQKSYIVSKNSSIDISFTLFPTDATSLYEIVCDNPDIIECYTTGGRTGVRIYGTEVGMAQITIFASNSIVLTSTVYVVADDSDYYQISCNNEEYTIPIYFEKPNGFLTISCEEREKQVILVALYDIDGRMIRIEAVKSNGIMMEILNTAIIKVYAISTQGAPLGEAVTIICS